MKFVQGLTFVVLLLGGTNGDDLPNSPAGLRSRRSSQCRKTVDFDWSDDNCFLGPVSIEKDIASNVFHQLCPRARGKVEAPTSCDLYITCHDESLTVNRCPPGNHFHPMDKNCVDSHLFECSHPVIKDPSILLQGRSADSLDRKARASVHWVYGNSDVIRGTSNNQPDWRSDWCKDDEGIFQHPESCEYFIQCGSGRLFEKKCPLGTAFNPRLSICDHKANVDCQTYYGREKRSSLHSPWELGITSRNLEEIDRRRWGVPCGPEFVTPHPQFCNKFQVCSNGRVHTQECAKGTIFNPLLKVCTRPEGVDCGSRIRDFDTYDCQKGFQYSTTHPDDCHKFIECENEQIHVKSCPGKTVYNPEKQMCDFTYKTACKSLISLEHDIDINYRSRPMTHWNRPRRQDLAKYDCQYNYIAPLDGSCLAFIECENKRLFKKNCGPGTAYNPLLGQCDWPHNVRSADPEYCGRYLQCDGRKFVPKQCPRNHYYHPESGKCLPIEQVNCAGKRDDPRGQRKDDEYLQSK